jgi:type II secretory pathway component PulJ
MWKLWQSITGAMGLKAWAVVALVVVTLVTTIAVQASTIGRLNSQITVLEDDQQELAADYSTCRAQQEGTEEREGQSRTAAERQCLDAVRDAYDAGRLSHDDLRGSQAGGRWVPGVSDGGGGG